MIRLPCPTPLHIVEMFTKDNGVYLEFHPTHCVVKDSATHKELLRGPECGGLYKICFSTFGKGTSGLSAESVSCLSSIVSSHKESFHKESVTSESVPAKGTVTDFVPALLSSLPQCHLASKNVSAEVWHRRLGHPSNVTLQSLIKSFSLCSIPAKLDDDCVACAVGKSHRMPFSDSVTSYSCPLELVEMDLWGPAPYSSNGYCYYLSIIDVFSRYCWIYFLHKKSEVSQIFPVFHRLAEKQLGHTLKAIQTDGGGEFIALTSYLHSTGVKHRVTCPYTSQQNGIVERKHRHIVELGLTLLAQASMPLHYWSDAFFTAAFLINRLPSAPLGNISPHDKLFSVPPDHSYLRVFGCLCFPFLRPYNRYKLDFRSSPCVFLGYTSSHRGYKCMDSSGNVYISRHVVFHEKVYPFADKGGEFLRSQASKGSVAQFLSPSDLSLFLPPEFVSDANSVPNSPIAGTDSALESSQSLDSPTDTSDTVDPSADLGPAHVGSSTDSVPGNVHSMVTRSKAKVPDSNFEALVVALGGELLEPDSIHVAMRDPLWQDAVQAEMQALVRNQTWSLVSLPEGRIPIGCKWIFRIKKNSDGTISRYKARLVAKGFSQKPGFDFQETFSPVVKPQSVRIILTLAISNQWSLRQIDINNAFLHGDLDETVYMVQPPGFEQFDAQGNLLVCKLRKALYGLKQAPRAWFEKFKSFLVHSLGFKATVSDSCVFTLSTPVGMVYLLVYVDDIVVTGSDSAMIECVITRINAVFQLKDLGKLNYFLGMEVRMVDKFLLLNQSKYISELFLKVGLVDDGIVIPTPMVGVSTSKSGQTPCSDPQLYRRTLGALQYICVTRPDICFSVNKLSQFVENPTDLHWRSVLRILRYKLGVASPQELLRGCPDPVSDDDEDTSPKDSPIEDSPQGPAASAEDNMTARNDESSIS